jgi:hypothetical protein
MEVVFVVAQDQAFLSAPYMQPGERTILPSGGWGNSAELETINKGPRVFRLYNFSPTLGS